VTEYPTALARNPAYATAFADWLACACAGADERASRAVRGTGTDLPTRVAFAATAGHIHDFDDTFSDGVAHVSATCAPAALVVAADLGATLGEALAAYAEAYEVMAACAAASHPALYDAGWHPTAVCGPIGAAVAASRLLRLSAAEHEHALRLALLRTGGTRGAFGSDGKALQVGLAAAHGVQAARLARGGVRVDERTVRGELGFEGVFGARAVTADADADASVANHPAIERNWIKLYPSCLGTHSPIETALDATARGHDLTHGPLTVTVHPVGRQAAHLDRVLDPLEGKFSIPYCVGLTITSGAPRLADFAAIAPEAVQAAARITVTVDSTLPEFGAVLASPDAELARRSSPSGSPERPVSAAELAGKVDTLTGGRLVGVLDDLDAPAADALSAARLSETTSV
jgi:2-methylcitrate dehydratase PrpD